MSKRLMTSCFLACSMLLPIAAYSADPQQTDPGYISPQRFGDPEQTDPGHLQLVDRGQTDPGYPQVADRGQTDPGHLQIVDREQTDPGYLQVADRGQTDPGHIAPVTITAHRSKGKVMDVPSTVIVSLADNN